MGIAALHPSYIYISVSRETEFYALAFEVLRRASRRR